MDPLERGRRVDAQLGAERLGKLLVVPQRQGPLPGLDQALEDLQVRGLVERVVVEQVGPPLRLPQQPLPERPEPVPRGADPRVIRLGGEQVPAVAAERPLGRGHRAVGQGRLGRLLEPVGVHDHLGAGKQLDLLPAENHPVGEAEGAACVVGRLVQARRGVGDGDLGPQQVDHLLPVQPVAGAEGEQLDEGGRVATRPGAVRHGLATDPHGEPAQQVDLHPVGPTGHGTLLPRHGRAGSA